MLAYGNTEAEARTHAVSLAYRVIADRIDNGEPIPEEARDLFAAFDACGAAIAPTAGCTSAAGSGRGLWGRHSARTTRRLRDEWSR